ncbi:MAG: Lrp/AsnC family transcriptional regulator [Chloroflexi bacterium]|nr:Lrp/AsnC family transcriptional regulator [Chloroflexota bacterium]
MTASTVPVSIADPVNQAILAVSEDRVHGFKRDPLGEIASRSGVPLPVVIDRIRAMLEAGTIRRVRQTLMSTKLAEGALAAWEIPEDRLHAAFDFMFQEDPSSGHVVVRTTELATPGSRYRLWTTLKVPQGYSIESHARYLAGRVGASHFRLMPARKLFVLGVGHTRRRTLAPGSRADVPADAVDTQTMTLSELDWRVLTALKREFEPHELVEDIWAPRAAEAGVPLDSFFAAAESLDARGLLGRFSTFLEHVKALATGERVTRYNALFHWAVPPGKELAAGGEVGRHDIMTHAYWREGGAEFNNVNVMGVAHGTDKQLLLDHKAAIDAHLAEAGVEVRYTNVFWGGRSEIKPSEISPIAYREWCVGNGIDPETMRDPAQPKGDQ